MGKVSGLSRPAAVAIQIMGWWILTWWTLDGENEKDLDSDDDSLDDYESDDSQNEAAELLSKPTPKFTSTSCSTTKQQRQQSQETKLGTKNKGKLYVFTRTSRINLAVFLS